ADLDGRLGRPTWAKAGPAASSGPAGHMACAALVAKISKTTPCKVADSRRHDFGFHEIDLTRRANHLHYSIIAQSVGRKRTWHQWAPRTTRFAVRNRKALASRTC